MDEDNNQQKKVSDYSIKELREICQATAPDPARESKVGKFSRIFSIYLTRVLISTPLNPNQITVISVIVFFCGVILFFFGSYYLNIIGSLLVFLSIVLDGCDGEVARFRKQFSRFGGTYVEPVSHDIQYGLSFLLVGAALYINGFTPWLMLVGAVAAVAKLGYRLLEAHYWMLMRADSSQEEIREIKESYDKKPLGIRLVYWVNKNFFSSTGLFLVLCITSLINRPDLFLWFFAIGFFCLYMALITKQVLSTIKFIKI